MSRPQVTQSSVPLGRVRLREHLGEEEREEAAVVAAQGVAVVAGPALVDLALGVEDDRRLVTRPGVVVGQRGADHAGAVDALGVAGGEQQRAQPAAREPEHAGRAQAAASSTATASAVYARSW